MDKIKELYRITRDHNHAAYRVQSETEGAWLAAAAGLLAAAVMEINRLFEEEFQEYYEED